MYIKLDLLAFYIKFMSKSKYPGDILPHMRARMSEEYEKKDFRSWENYIKDLYYEELKKYL